MSPPRAISLVGWSTAGKSTLIAQLLSELRSRGLRVAAIKHSSDRHPLHKAGSDTEAFQNSGADVVGFATPGGIQLTYPAGEEELLTLLSRLPVDLVLVEGWKSGPLRKIEVWNRSLGPPWAASGAEIAALVTDDPPPFSVTCFAPGDLPGLVLFILEEALVVLPPSGRE